VDLDLCRLGACKFVEPKTPFLNMPFLLVKNGIFKEGVLGSTNLHAPSLHKSKSTPQKAKKSVKN
jgi:hypothetical protein